MKTLFLFLTPIVLLFSSCKDNSDLPTPNNPSSDAWVKVYKNVTLYNDRAASNSPYFKSSTGEAISIAGTAGQRKKMALVFYAGSFSYTHLSSPSGFRDNSPLYTFDRENPLFKTPSNGLDFWTIDDDNSFKFKLASSMSRATFDNFVDTADWQDFNTLFKASNSGKEHISSSLEYILNVKDDKVYLIELNDGLRMILCVTATSSRSDGYLRFDVIIEGGDHIPSHTRHLMPSK